MPAPAPADISTDLVTASFDPSALTILRSANGRRCAKHFIRQPDGTVGIVPYDRETRWFVEVVQAANLALFTETLELLSRCQDRIVVRGALREGVLRAPVARRCVGAEVAFRPAPRAWVALDVDGLDLGALPPTAATEATPYAALIATTINRLPARFRNVACWWQLTSSYGVRDPITRMRARLWFRLSHPVGDQAWKRTLRPDAANCCIDLSLYNPVQPHFVAAPTFEGMVDPIATRTGVHDPAGARMYVDTSNIPNREEVDEGLVLISSLTRTGIDAHPDQISAIVDRFATRSRAASRHSTAVALIGELYGHGMSGEEAMRYARRYMEQQGRPPERGELERALLFVQRRAADGTLRTNDTPISLLFDEEPTDALEPPPEAPATPEEAEENAEENAAVTGEWPTQPNAMARRALADLFAGDGYLRWGIQDFEWIGTYWRPMPDDEDLGARIQRASDATPTAVERAAKALRNMCHRGFLRPPCRVEDGSAIPPRIVAENGWLSVEAVRTGGPARPVSEAHTPTIFDVLPPMPVRFDAAARCPRFDQFLDECFAGDAESRTTLVKLMGYLLFKGNEYQRVFICSGRGASGKSTWLRVMRALLGPGRGAVGDLSDFSSDFGLQDVYQAQALFLPEASHSENGATLAGQAVDQLKRISGGDPVTVRRKFLSSVTVDQMPTPVVLCNTPPVIRDEAFVRRLVTVHFPHSFLGREDPTLTDRLLTELPGILNVALYGLSLIAHERDPFPPPALAAASADGVEAVATPARELYEQIRADASPVAEFVRECLRPGDAPLISQDELHGAYRRWCAHHHHRPLEMRRFAASLRMSVQSPMEWTRRRLPDSGERAYGVVNATWAPESGRFRSDASVF